MPCNLEKNMKACWVLREGNESMLGVEGGEGGE
jgi:hypothetical protein